MPSFLTHLYFGKTPEIRIGNLAYDFLSPPRDISVFPADFQIGMQIHRKIDSFNDSHKMFYEGMGLMKSVTHLAYAHVVMDILNDHFLAINWQKYHDQPLEDFANDTYLTLLRNHEVLPYQLKRVLPVMIKENWLSSYATRRGILRDLDRLTVVIDERWNRDCQLGLCITDYDENFDTLNQNFNSFFPELIEAAKNWP